MKVLAIPDLHAPFTHTDAYAFLKAVKQKHKPTTVVCLGDETDAHALSQYVADPDGHSPGHELAAAIEQLKPLYKLFPDVLVCLSNHGERVFKKAFISGIPKAYLKGYKEFMQAPTGWHWKESHTIDGVLYRHGYGLSGAAGALMGAKDIMRPLVIGHLHSYAGVQYFNNGHAQIFGFNVGCLVDRSKYVFDYAKHSRAKPTLGCGIIDNGVPMFIPMLLNSNDRWIGTL